MQKIRFIVNPISGINRNPQKIVRWIEEIIKPSGRTVEIVYTREPGDGTRLGKEAVALGFDLVVAVGGDGTINEISSGIMGSRAILGVIPAGSGNGFARNFDIPLTQRKAIQILLSPRIITIDAGKINNRYFFNVAGIGLDAEISQNFEQFGFRGPIPYFIIGTKSFLQYKPKLIKIILDNQELEYSPLLLSIANAPQYGNGAVIAPAAKPDDGLLDICILDAIPFWKAASNIHRLFNGTIDQIEGFHSFQAKELSIQRVAAGAIHTDGNPFREEAFLKVQVVPNALKVAVAE